MFSQPVIRLLLAVASIVASPLQSAYAATYGSPRDPGICLAETALDERTRTGRLWQDAKDAQQLLAAIDPASSSICKDWIEGEMSRVLASPNLVKDRNCYVMSDEAYEAAISQRAAIVRSCQTGINAQAVLALNPRLAARYQEAVTRDATAAKVAAERATQMAAAAEERKLAETRKHEAQQAAQAAVTANFRGPMLCMLGGKSKPTLYLDLGGNDAFALVMENRGPVSGKWGRGTFQGSPAFFLQAPPSPGDSFPDMYTVYEESIQIGQETITFMLARRSTFPGSRSAEAYEAVCNKVKPMSLAQAQQLVASNVKNNPLTPEALTRIQQREANRPSVEYCVNVEDTYADRPALQRLALRVTGCR